MNNRFTLRLLCHKYRCVHKAQLGLLGGQLLLKLGAHLQRQGAAGHKGKKSGAEDIVKFRCAEDEEVL